MTGAMLDREQPGLADGHVGRQREDVAEPVTVGDGWARFHAMSRRMPVLGLAAEWTAELDRRATGQTS